MPQTNPQSDQAKYLEHLVQNIPHQPGVYKMKDKDNRIIYIGKAKDLRNRVGSYFKNSTDKGMRTLKMVEQIADIEYIIVGSDLEAIILETNLIKELRPKYNILMKDDKSYVYIKITVNEEYPRIYLVRKVNKDKARYFGPKTATHKVIKTLKILKSIFPFRNCTLAMDYNVRHDGNTDKPLSTSQMQYHINHCLGPCITSVSAPIYRQMIEQVIGFLQGKHEEIIAKVKEDMLRAATEKKFEIAGALRDKLKAVEEIVETQRISDPHQKDLDIINYCEQDNKIYFVLFQLRSGKLIGQEQFVFKGEEIQKEDILSSLLEQYYEKAADLPNQVLLPENIEDTDSIADWLTQMKGTKVQIIVPERGKKNHLLDLALSNAQSFARQSQVKWQGHEKGNRDQAMTDLQKLLNLEKPPIRMECYDISHFAGTETVSSMVVFEKGFPKKEDYRHFKLHQQTSGEPNDFASMEETLTRRLKYLRPSIAAAEFKIIKSTKKELIQIAKRLKIKKLPTSDLHTIKKDKKWIGFVEVINTANKKVLINKISLEKDQKIDLNQLIKKLVGKYKVARIYLSTTKNEVPKFEEVGCQKVQKIPDVFKIKPGQQVLVYDKNKYIEDKSFKKTPDLIIIDGGKGQLSSALKPLTAAKLNIPIISLAKREEELYLPNNSTPIKLAQNNPILLMIKHIRDESHRFAVTYHQKLRLKATTSSVLDTIFGLGPELKMKLLQKFGSVENIKLASESDLSEVVGAKITKTLKSSL